MPWYGTLAIATLAVYALGIALLVAAGRRDDARALAGFIPDCLVLFRRLLTDPRVPRRDRLIIVGVLAYLASPIDLVPDFIPVAGQLDDALVVAIALRRLSRGNDDLIADLWPGPSRSLRYLTRARSR